MQQRVDVTEGYKTLKPLTKTKTKDNVKQDFFVLLYYKFRHNDKEKTTPKHSLVFLEELSYNYYLLLLVLVAAFSIRKCFKVLVLVSLFSVWIIVHL